MTTIADIERMKSIQEPERATFSCLFEEEYADRLALVRCYLDNVPTAAVCLVDRDETSGDYILSPLYVQITDQMNLKGPDGDPMPRMTDH